MKHKFLALSHSLFALNIIIQWTLRFIISVAHTRFLLLQNKHQQRHAGIANMILGCASTGAQPHKYFLDLKSRHLTLIGRGLRVSRVKVAAQMCGTTVLVTMVQKLSPKLPLMVHWTSLKVWILRIFNLLLYFKYHSTRTPSWAVTHSFMILAILAMSGC